MCHVWGDVALNILGGGVAIPETPTRSAPVATSWNVKFIVFVFIDFTSTSEILL